MTRKFEKHKKIEDLNYEKPLFFEGVRVVKLFDPQYTPQGLFYCEGIDCDSSKYLLEWMAEFSTEEEFNSLDLIGYFSPHSPKITRL